MSIMKSWDVYALEQGWENSSPRAECGPPQRFKWPAEAVKKRKCLAVQRRMASFWGLAVQHSHHGAL